MKIIKLLIYLLALQLIACGKSDKRNDSDSPNKDALILAKESLLVWSEKCAGGVAKKDCNDGDSTLWNGLLCGSGEAIGCEAVKLSQSENGRVWRSPRLKENDPVRTFSRDMGLGTLVYLARTKNVEFGNKWSAYINGNKGLCEKGNSSCNISSTFFRTYNIVAEKVGFNKLSSSVQLTESRDLNSDSTLLYLQAQTVPRGYQTHLIGVHLYSRVILGVWDDTLQKTANLIHKREPKNLFFKYLSLGKSQELADELLSLIPAGPNEIRNQWCWERADSENACKDSMGWDFVFAINLMLN